MRMREIDEKITTFIGKLASLDAGEKARLRRDAGKTISECQNLGLFYRLLPYGVPGSQEEIYFMVATLYPLLNQGGTGNFGTILHTVRDNDEKKNKGLDRRVEILLDSDLDQLRFRLRQAVRFVRSRNPESKMNWAGLLDDLLHWSSPSRYIQQEWAREYFKLPQPLTEPSDNHFINPIEKTIQV